MVSHANKPTNNLSIYLIKDDYSEPETILKNFNKSFSQDISGVGTLYFGESHVYKPQWIENFFGSQLDGNEHLFNAGSKAVLLIDVNIDTKTKKIFAIPFGYGWTMLTNGSYEERFGLRVTLNAVDAENLRRIDKKSLASIPKHTSEQLSQDGDSAGFGIDIEQDLIQAITGKTIDSSFGPRITGRDSVHLWIKADISNIKEFLTKCYEKYISKDYQENFGWIDQIAEIKDPNLIESLNLTLINKIKNKQVEKIWMAVPELIDWVTTAGFGYRESETDLKTDLFLIDFLNSLSEEKMNDLSIDIFKKRKVFGFDTQNDQIKYHWSAYNCLYCEIVDDDKGKTYLLSNGTWYEIEKDFVTQVNKDFYALRSQPSSLKLLNYKDKDEQAYNIRISENDTNYCCMDRKNISYGGGRSKIEFCDLVHNTNKLIHVKYYSGSAVLSHLFSQGTVSGELFIADKEFRDKVNDKLASTHKFSNITDRPKPENYEIIFAIISSIDKELEIPFFSKVTLRNAKRRLEAFGYKVSLQKISIDH